MDRKRTLKLDVSSPADEQSTNTSTQINTCSSEVIQVARIIISQQRFELRFIIFHVFMAGFASKGPNEKEEALEIIKTIEKHSYGSIMESVRMLLETVKEKQRAAILQTGRASAVDWLEEMEKNGLIIYGL
jgi:hypothetical protein